MSSIIVINLMDLQELTTWLNMVYFLAPDHIPFWI
jgi:hypothetical protein